MNRLSYIYNKVSSGQFLYVYAVVALLLPMAWNRKRALIFAYQRPLSLSVFDCFDFAPCLHHEKH